MHLQQAVNKIFVQLEETIGQLSHSEYIQPCRVLVNNTIGQHVRHIIEIFQCLDTGYPENLVDYEKRKRDINIETNKTLALGLLRDICTNLERPNKEMILQACYDDHTNEPISIDTNYFREIAYNLEHAIHHMALIRIGINEISGISLPENFGVAFSTIKHRRQCAQ